MAEWIISGNPKKYDVIGAFRDLGIIGWGQSANMEVGDIVYIYVSGDVRQIKFRCRVNAVNQEDVAIDDSDYGLSDENDDWVGRYMELEMLEEFSGDQYSREALIKYGFISPRGPMHLGGSLKKRLEKIGNKGINNKKFSVNEAIWIAAASFAFMKYKKNTDISVIDCLMTAPQIIELASEYTTQDVQPARIHQHCNGDHDKCTHRFLRRIGNDDGNVKFRATAKGEFKDDKYIPSDLAKSEKIVVSGEGVIIKELTDFIEGPYKDKMLSQFIQIEYWPSLEAYNPGVTKEQWLELLKNAIITKSEDLRLFKCWLLEGGESTCANVAEKYGGTPAMYNMRGSNYADKVLQRLNIAPCQEGDKLRTFPIVFVGRNVTENGRSRYSWKLRDELKEALEEMDLSAIDVNVKETETREFDKNMILYGPPGTGKTYNTAIYAVAICDGISIIEAQKKPYGEIMDRYKELKDVEKRVAFTTFHQSYGYEEFIEGIKPKMDSESSDVEYTIKDGVFKEFCDRASKKKATSGNLKVREDAVVWSIILGGNESPDLKQKCYDEGSIRIGWHSWPEVIADDIENLNDKERRILINFQDEMEIGDIVVVRSTASSVDGIGIVSGEAEFDSSIEKYPRKRKVDWICTGEDIEIIELNGGTKLDRKCVYPLRRVNVGDLLSRVPLDAGVELEDETRPYVFIIDEINRGNISKIFGELITLIEDTKREGMEESASAILPYSNTPFSVPGNVYILGTMNTADRSIALMDTALRRRFQFIEKMPDANVLRTIGADKVSEAEIELDVAYMLEIINDRITYLFDREHTIGHAFFTGLKDEPTVAKLANIFKKSIIPLLQEYFYEDYSKIMLVLGDNGKKNDRQKFILATETKLNKIFKGDTSDIDIPDYSYEIQESAFEEIMSYIGITD